MATSPHIANEELLRAAGITDEQMKSVVGATLVLRPGHVPVMNVEFAIWDEKIEVVAKAIAAFDLVRSG